MTPELRSLQVIRAGSLLSVLILPWLSSTILILADGGIEGVSLRSNQLHFLPVICPTPDYPATPLALEAWSKYLCSR